MKNVAFKRDLHLSVYSETWEKYGKNCKVVKKLTLGSWVKGRCHRNGQKIEDSLKNGLDLGLC